MTNLPIISPDLVLLDVDAGADKQAVIERLAGLLAAAGRTGDARALQRAALDRESKSATGLPGGIAIPHCRTAAVKHPSIGFARLRPAVDFGAPDGPADLVFLIAAPEGAGSEHMTLLSGLARALVRPDFVASLRTAATDAEIVALVDAIVSADTAPVPITTVAPQGKSIIAITACPTGIAHTYMAADALKLAARRAGVQLTVETQGSSGSTPVSAATIAGERAAASSSACSSPLAPSEASNNVGIVTERNWPCATWRSLASSSLVMMGVESSMRWQLSGVGSSRLPSGPIVVMAEVTISSRIQSMGGLVTCANSCLK